MSDLGRALLALTGPGSRFSRGDQFNIRVAAAYLTETPGDVGDDLGEALVAMRDQAAVVLDTITCTVLAERYVADRWHVHLPARAVYWAGPGEALADDVIAGHRLREDGPAQWRVTVYAGDRVDLGRVLCTVHGRCPTIESAPPTT